jgi:ribonuclease HI
MNSSKMIHSIATLQELQIDLHHPLPKTETPPSWISNQDHVIDILANYPKHSTPPEVYRKFHEEFTSRAQDEMHLYTDGSKTSTGVGIAVSSEDKPIRMYYMDSETSVFTAELMALVEATNIAIQTHTKVKIFTDSLSAVKAIKNINSKEYASIYIRNTAYKENGRIKIFWIPGHIGIPGNEMADALARQAAIFPNVKIPTQTSNQCKISIEKHLSKSQQ